MTIHLSAAVGVPLLVETPAEFRRALGGREFPVRAPAVASGVLLISPEGFRLGTETAEDNFYMAAGVPVSEERALAEHRALAAALARTLPVTVFAGDPDAPDGVFPNNVFATTPGRLIVGRMRHAVRRRESARADVRGHFASLGYATLDLSERDDLVAEMTGPLVIDRGRGVGFCGLSQRCDPAGAAAMARAFGLELTFVFELAPSEYHTNVVLSVLASRALVVHEESFADPEVPRAIAALYPGQVLRLNDAEKAAFVANSIALAEDEVWMSARAESALRPASRRALESWGFRIRSVPLDEIEKAGGSLRCCVAEIF